MRLDANYSHSFFPSVFLKKNYLPVSCGAINFIERCKQNHLFHSVSYSPNFSTTGQLWNQLKDLFYIFKFSEMVIIFWVWKYVITCRWSVIFVGQCNKFLSLLFFFYFILCKNGEPSLHGWGAINFSLALLLIARQNFKLVLIISFSVVLAFKLRNLYFQAPTLFWFPWYCWQVVILNVIWENKVSLKKF